MTPPLAPATWRRSTVWVVAAVAVVTLLVRLVLMWQPLHADEAGYLQVARGWRNGGPNLYGRYWVDRPPGLIGLFKLASLFEWPQAIRLLAAPFVVLFVVSASWAAHQVAGDRAARWSAVLAGAFAASPLLATQEADGELFAAPLVMLSVALTLAAVRRTGAASYWFAAAAGLAAGLAVSVKQNFADAGVFALVYVVAAVLQGRMPAAQGLRVLASAAAGGVVVLAAVAGWATWTGPGVGELWYDLFGFRSAALDVITDNDLQPAMWAALDLLRLGVLSGVVAVLLLLGWRAWRSRLHGSPLAWAVGFTLVIGNAGVALGGSYWPHYLIELAPMLVLAAGVWVSEIRWMAAVIALAVFSTLVATIEYTITGRGSNVVDSRVGSWVGAMSRPGDTLTVLFGHEELQLESGLSSPYPYLWTLPRRTLDPDLRLLRALLAGPAAPTWTVVTDEPNTWGSDAHDTTRLTLATHYRLVRRACGREVWLHDGVDRRVLPPPPSC